jgi:hypothetical protein
MGQESKAMEEMTYYNQILNSFDVVRRKEA